MNDVISFGLCSVGAGPSPEEPVEEPPEGLQPDGAAGGQRLPAAHRDLLHQHGADHGRGRCLQLPHIHDDVLKMYNNSDNRRLFPMRLGFGDKKTFLQS